MRADLSAPAQAPQEKAQGGHFDKLKDAATKRSDEQARGEVVKLADTQVRHRLAALKALSPLALAVVQRPGFNADDGELLAAIKQLRDETERASRELVMLMGGENQPPVWMVKAISATVAEYVAAEWVSGAETLDMSPYQPIWGYLADADFADFEAKMPKEVDLDQDAMLRLSMVKAMSLVVSTTRRSYMMRHDPATLYPTIANLIINTASANVSKIVPADASEGSQLMTLQSLIARAAEVFCLHWDGVVKPTVDYLLQMDKEQRVALYREHPNGLPLNKIVERFSADMARIVNGVASFDFKPVAPSSEIKIGE